MTRDTLLMAIKEAERFAAVAKRLRDEWRKAEIDYPVVGTRLSGSVRRASLDLTRALADMRKP